MPLTMAVGFAMISSYLLSSTFVPIMSVYLLKHKQQTEKSENQQPGLFERIKGVYHGAADWVIRLGHGWCRSTWSSAGSSWSGLGSRSVPSCFRRSTRVSSCSRFRPPPGSSFELTREMGMKCLQEIENEAGTENVKITMGFVGQVRRTSASTTWCFSCGGPDDGWLRVALSQKSGIKLDEFRERLRKILPERVIPWLTERLMKGGGSGGLPRNEARDQAERAQRSASSPATSSAR